MHIKTILKERKNWRRLSQIFFLLLFIFLFLTTKNTGENQLGYPVKFFLNIDPLIALSQLLANYVIPATFAWALFVVFFTMVMGRFFCGWVCPLGTIHHLVSKLNPRKISLKELKTADESKSKKYFDWIKYFIFIIVLIGAFFGLPLAGFLDPISLLIRSMTILVYPIFDYSAKSFFLVSYLSDIPIITPFFEWIYQGIRSPLLQLKDIYFQQSLFIGGIFLVILLLNLYVKRFWCRYICPLGALLGFLSKFSLFGKNHVPSCSACMHCSKDCSVDAHPDSNEKWKRTECMYLFNCESTCPTSDLSFGFRKINFNIRSLWKPDVGDNSVDLSKRRTLTALASGVLAVPLLKMTPLAQLKIFNPELIRPPGALAEKDFIETCIKCGECMKVCPTGGLQPTFLEAGLQGMWTPLLVPKLGYCEFSCTLCSQVCPTDAIQKIPLKEKQKLKIGTAVIDKNLCLPHSHEIGCIVCEEMCPTAPKAIELDLKTVTISTKKNQSTSQNNLKNSTPSSGNSTNPYGESVSNNHINNINQQKQNTSDPYANNGSNNSRERGDSLPLDKNFDKQSVEKKQIYLPRINLKRCIGCGICEANCPVISNPAIYVQSFGESRSRNNGMI